MKIDTLEKENFKEPFVNLNPNATIPMLTHGQTKVIGDGEAIYNYLVNTNDPVRETFFHED